MKKLFSITLFLIVNLTLVSSQGIIIDHSCIDLSTIPGNWIDSAKVKLKVTYQHTSHGSQLVSGINAIASTYGGAYNFTYSGWGLNPDVFFNDYGMPAAGDLGHNGDLAWRDATIEILNNPESNRNVVIWSWCGGVSDNDSTGIYTYLNAMSSLESSYPEVKFVYMTGHLDGGGANGNLNLMNNLIRDYCISNNKILFDFADIESYAPNDSQNYMEWCALDGLNYDPTCNNPWAGPNWGEEWISSHPGHPYVQVTNLCTECAHSDNPAEAKLNCVLKGNAVWWMFAKLAGWEQGSTAIKENQNQEFVSVYPVPASTEIFIKFTGIPNPGMVEIIDLKGEKLLDKQFSPGTEKIKLDFRSLKNGIYFIRIVAGDYIQTKKLIVNRQ